MWVWGVTRLHQCNSISAQTLFGHIRQLFGLFGRSERPIAHDVLDVGTDVDAVLAHFRPTRKAARWSRHGVFLDDIHRSGLVPFIEKFSSPEMHDTQHPSCCAKTLQKRVLPSCEGFRVCRSLPTYYHFRTGTGGAI